MTLTLFFYLDKLALGQNFGNKLREICQNMLDIMHRA